MLSDLGQFLKSDEDIEACCAKLFRSDLFIRNADRVRFELISIAMEVCISVDMTNRRNLLSMRNCILYIGSYCWTVKPSFKHYEKSGKRGVYRQSWT